MKNYLAVLMVILIAAGCGIFDDDDDKKPTPAYTGAKYFPLKTGSAWTYNFTETDSLGSQSSVTTINSNIGTIRRNNATYNIIYDSNKGDSLLVRLRNNVLRSFRRVGATEEEQLSDVPLIDFNADIGDSWTIYSQTYSLQGFVISQNIKGDFIGIETVQVPAGDINDCLRYRIIETTSIKSDASADSTTNQEDIWLAPDIGKVRRTGEYYRNNVLRENFTEEIITYTIPQ